MQPAKPRPLTRSDLGDNLNRLKSAAGWNQVEQDWDRLLTLAPDACVGIDVEGSLVATSTAVSYGHDLAWIGMVLTLPEFRRRGFARILLQHSLGVLDARQVRCIKLDATDMGRPLYESAGFEVEGTVERWARPPQPGSFNVKAQLGQPDFNLDRAVFGADRSHLLMLLAAQEGVSLPDGSYAMGRAGSNATYFGPCIAHEVEGAEMLLNSFLGRHSHEAIYWDILPGNSAAVVMATRYGFERARILHRMVRGPRTVRDDVSKIWAIAGLEYG